MKKNTPKISEIVPNHIKLTRLDNSKLGVLYGNEDKGFSEKLKKRVWISHLIFKNAMKVSNYQDFYIAVKEDIKDIMSKAPETKASNSILLTFIFLLSGIRYFPDIKQFGLSMKVKEEAQQLITFGGIIFIIDRTQSRSKEILNEAIKIYGNNNNLLTAESYSQAYLHANQLT